MPRSSRHIPLIEIIPVLAGGPLILCLLVPGGREILQALTVLIPVGLFILAVLVGGGIFAYRAFKRTSADKDDSLNLSLKESLDEPWNAPHQVEPIQQRNIINSLREIDWYQFEMLVAILYRKAGAKVERRGGANPDGGIDMIITGTTGERKAIQCKHWKKWKITPKTIREFIGALKDAQIQKGIFVALDGYTPDARQLAERNGIELIDEKDLGRLMESSDARFDPEVLELLNGVKKICPKCENELILRTAKKGPNPGSQFWGCSKYPQCNYIMVHN